MNAYRAGRADDGGWVVMDKDGKVILKLPDLESAHDAAAALNAGRERRLNEDAVHRSDGNR